MQVSEKRYYWLKLRNTYFKQLNQVKMRRQEHGKDMQIIYLKMMLYSLDNNGEIYYEGVFGSLAEEIALKIDENTEIVEETLDFLKENGMITILSNDSESIAIPETVDCTGSEAYSTERSRRCREKQRCNATDLQQSATGCNQEKNIEKENRVDIEKEERVQISYQEIADLYNDICISFPRLTKLSEARKKAIRARCRQYSTEDFKKLFEMAEGSSFLKGANDRNWSASFDWLIADKNMAKVLDGNYKDKSGNKKPEQSKKPYQQFDQREYSKAEMDELERKLLNR